MDSAGTQRVTTFPMYAAAVEAGQSFEYLLPQGGTNLQSEQDVLRFLIDRQERRRRGTFFTSPSMARELWADALSTIREGSIVVDPACGAGDLLIPAIEQAHANGIRDVTFKAIDIDPHFVRLANARLTAMDYAVGRLVTTTLDFLRSPEGLADATHVAINPPFVPMTVDEPWARGIVNSAAVFLLRAVQTMPRGSRLLAILPDVLRSGSRYEKWRRTIAGYLDIQSVTPLDQFDDKTDVHVFKLDAIVGSASLINTTWISRAGGPVLADHCLVNVGAVVPHRSPLLGPEVGYVTARSLTAGTILRRQFSGKLIEGPVVLVNRTSRPDEIPRVRARLWSGRESIAVENHLLVLRPKSDLVTSCEEIHSKLTHPSTAQFLNARIRCRHLTVAAMKEIPWER